MGVHAYKLHFLSLYSQIVINYAKMKLRYYILTVLLLWAGGVMAQSKDAARKLFQQGKYDQAKPMFQKLLKRYPQNAEYNYWYAVCCYETNDSVDILPMLEYAASRKISNSYRYLGDYHAARLDYPQAISYYNDFVDVTPDDALREEYGKRLSDISRLNRMVMNCAKVCIVDSFVVKKRDLFSVYNIGHDAGVVSTQADFFDDSSLAGNIYCSERGMDICFSDLEDDGLMKLYSNSKVGDEWGRAKRLAGFDTKGNDDYPFMLSDGVTLYFASDGEGSIGGYDLFVTRLNTESGRFLRPDNLGMPFNSTANDYMLAINEVANLGWFATDRNQPDSLACVYLFVPNGGVSKYDEALGFETLLSRAQISSIADTQDDESVLRKAVQQYAMLLYGIANGDVKNEFCFVMDDSRDYIRLSDFVSEAARELFVEWRERKAAQDGNIALLELKRDEYASAGLKAKEAMRDEILTLEKKVEEEQDRLAVMEREIRRLEQEELYQEEFNK